MKEIYLGKPVQRLGDVISTLFLGMLVDRIDSAEGVFDYLCFNGRLWLRELLIEIIGIGFLRLEKNRWATAQTQRT